MPGFLSCSYRPKYRASEYVVFKSETKSQLSSYSSRRHIMRTTESGKKVIERNAVRKINYRDLSAPFVLVPMQQIVIADCNIEQTALGDTWWVFVIIFLARCRNAYQRRAILRCRTEIRPQA